MQIGLITAELSYAHGWAHYSHALAEALHNIGVDLTIISAKNSPDVPYATVHKLLPTVTPRARYFTPRLLGALPHVRRLLQACDVIHATAEPYAPLAALVRGKRPLFVTAHGTYVYIDRLHRFPFSALYRHAMRSATLICVSHYTARTARQHLQLSEQQTPVVPNGIFPQRFAQLPQPFPEKRPTILTTGGVKRRKGTLELVNALAEVRKTVPDARLVVLGHIKESALYTQEVREAIARHHLTEAVQLEGFVSEEALLRWYATADVFALPSQNHGYNFEGFGLVHLEASAASLPVVGTRDCGIEDAIDDGITGFLVPQKDTHALAEALTRVLTDEALAKHMGEAGRQKAKQQTWERVAQQVLALYQQAIKNGHN